jgi:hypothetical protein
MSNKAKFLYELLQLFVLLLAAAASYSQSETETDSIIFTAMKDEINRSMTELTYKDLAKPCYIDFQFSREKTLEVSAELGALMCIDSARNTGWSYRFIVGSYDINDENFQSPNNKLSNDIFSSIQAFPLEADYFGIRRALWLVTNDIYKSAGSNYKEKMKLIESGKIAKEMLSLPDFSEAPQVSLFIKRETDEFTINMIRDAVTGLSAAFYQYPSIDWSGADVVYYKNDIYFQNSEGSRFKIPFDIAAITISMAKENKNKEKVSRSMTAYSKNPGNLPLGTALEDDLKLFAGLIDSLTVDRSLESDYQGPVMFSGDICTEMLLNNLFEETHSLVAERNNLTVKQNGNIYFETINNKWQDHVGKRILPEGITIIDTPALKNYNGTDLLGNFPIDRDGVVPPDSMILVESGTLKSMFGSRTPTSVTRNSNGHGRHYFNFRGGIAYMQGPSVLQITSSSNHEYESMKKMLLASAKGELLDFAIIIKSPAAKVSRMPYIIYKVDVETGKEEVVNNVAFDAFIDLPEMKKLVFGGNGFLYNSLWHEFENSRYNGMKLPETNDISGYPVSVIGPEYMIVNDMKVTTKKKEDMLHSAGDDISNPLK